MQKKLLIVTDEMEVGGTQRQILELAKYIDQSSFSMSVVYFRKGSRYVEELRKAGVEVTRIPKRRRIDPVFLYRLCRYIRRNDFDVIHAFSLSGELWSWLANALAGNARFVSSIRSMYEWYSPLQWMAKRWVTRGSAALVANSCAGAEHAALRMGIRRNTIDIVHNGVRMPPMNEIDAAPGDDDGKQHVLFVGRLVDHKNLHCLLKGFALARPQAGDTVLDIVGDGPQRAELEAAARKLGIEEYVNFHGERDDVPEFMRRAHVFVCTSFREGLSNAVIEAMSFGIPTVASNVGGNPELVTHDRSGLLFPNDDHETLAAMLVELLNDADKRATLGKNARSDLQRFHDPGQMASEMERIYERCLVDEKAFVMGR